MHSTIDIIDYVNERNLLGILTNIEFGNISNTIRWRVMHKVLEKMNFGPYIRKCQIKTTDTVVTTP